jgi:fatty-acyl-CoA synthase
MILRAIARNDPDALALWDETEALSFSDFGARVGATYALLCEAGLRRGDGLAQLSRNKCDALVVIAAAFILGLRYTPLHPLSSADDHAFILADAEIRALVVDELSFADRVTVLKPALGPDGLLFSHRAWEVATPLITPDVGGKLPQRSAASANDIALIAYTGGTTGKPKGVVHRNPSLLANLLIALGEWEWPERPRFLAVTPISHAAFLFVLPVWLRGGAFGLSTAFSPSGFVDAVRARDVNTTFVVPTMIYALLDAGVAKSDIASLETIIYGAAPIAPQRLGEALERWGPVFAQLYGQTEAPNAISMLFKRDHRADKLSSCGVTLASNQVALVDEQGGFVAPGDVGEICVRGPLVMSEYWKRPEETAEALAGGWLHTGDLARQDEGGFLYLVDRKKDMIISGGFNIYPSEVEDVLAGHAGVAQCCVAGVADPKWGEAVAALVRLQPGASVTPEDLAAFVKSKKGSMLAPKFVCFAGALPLTALGKPDRKAARIVLEAAYAAREREQ